MRFNKTEVINSETRFVTKFLWFPKTINGETRWLENVKFEMRFSVFVGLSGGWKCTKWIDEIQKEENLNEQS